MRHDAWYDRGQLTDNFSPLPRNGRPLVSAVAAHGLLTASEPAARLAIVSAFLRYEWGAWTHFSGPLRISSNSISTLG
jgi:hypothetical protein